MWMTSGLSRRGLVFRGASCNAIAVVEYVFSSLLMLAERDGFTLKDRTVGIVGWATWADVCKSVWKPGNPHPAVRSAA